MHGGEDGDRALGAAGLDEAGNCGGPGDGVSAGHAIEQTEGERRVGEALEVHIEEVVLEENGGGEEGENKASPEEAGVEGGAEAEVGG